MLSSGLRPALLPLGIAPGQAVQPRPHGGGHAAPCRASGPAPGPLSASSSSSRGSSATAAAAAAGATTSSSSSSSGSGRPLSGPVLQGLGPMDVLTASMIPRASESSDEGSDSYRSLPRVAYQGVPGAYSEMAANKACPDWDPLPCEQFEVAFQAISQWMADRAVLPIENSLGGSIHAVYDLLLRYQLHIVGEVSVEVNHCLLALPGVAKSDIRRVMSHPQALAQTDGYTRRMGPGVTREAVDDTAGAAKMIAENGWRDAAAVASRRAGELYGMNILDEGIQDMADNVTRFIVLSRDPLVAPAAPAEARRFKTSVVFSLQEGPGMLFKALSVFALRDIDLTKIESRPMRAQPLLLAPDATAGEGQRSFNYMFYVDFRGSLADPTCQNALRHLQEIAPFLRVLGSYPADAEM